MLQGNPARLLPIIRIPQSFTIQAHLLSPNKHKFPVETFSISPACSCWCSVILRSGGCVSRLALGTEPCWRPLRVWDLGQATSSSCRNQPLGLAGIRACGAGHGGRRREVQSSNVSVEPLPILRRLGVSANPSWQDGDPAFCEGMLEVTSVQSTTRSCNEPEQSPTHSWLEFLEAPRITVRMRPAPVSLRANLCWMGYFCHPLSALDIKRASALSCLIEPLMNGTGTAHGASQRILRVTRHGTCAASSTPSTKSHYTPSSPPDMDRFGSTCSSWLVLCLPHAQAKAGLAALISLQPHSNRGSTLPARNGRFSHSQGFA